VFRLLGAVEAVFGSRHVELGTPKQRIVLAVLLVEAPRAVGVEVLIDRVWDEAPAGAGRRMVSTYVSRLRRVLDEMQAADAGSAELVRRPGGYQLRVDSDLVDLHRFDQLVTRAEDRHRSDAERAGLLREALDLWQGEPLTDLPGAWAARTRRIWHQRRLDATVAWARLELRLGRHERVAGPVGELFAEHPLAEPLAATLITALHRDGRTAEALDSFAVIRRRLVDELGVEPGAELRAAHAEALGAGSAPSIVSVGRQLPADIGDFVGRTTELNRLRTAMLGPGPRLAAISGPPGVGKTALAVRAGHTLAPHFPDGQLFATLHGTTTEPTDSAEVLAHLLRMLGVDGAALPAGMDARGALLRSRLAGCRVLLILDDAAGHHQVLPLLPGADVAVIVTSRAPLTGLPAVTTLDLRPLPAPAAIELLGQVAGRDRVRAEPTDSADLVALCGGLPLAVRIAAARLAARPYWTVADLAGRLADERGRLDELRHGDLAVRPGLQVAYRGLTSAAARVFALLGKLNAQSFPEWTVDALLAARQPAGSKALEELVDARLLDELGPDQAGQQRYGFHEVTRAFARERQAADIDAAEWPAALARAATGWLTLARQASAGLHCERLHLDRRTDDCPEPQWGERAVAVAVKQPVDWFEAEREVLVKLVPACADAGLTGLALGLAACAADFFGMRAYYADWKRTTEVALAACRADGDQTGAASMLRGLGICLVEFDDLDAALATLHTALDATEQVGDHVGAALARRYIGYVLSLLGRLNEAEIHLRQATDAAHHAGIRADEAITQANLAFVQRQRDHTTAVRTARAALTIARTCDNLFIEAYVSRGLAGAELAAGRVSAAQRLARRAVHLFDEIGDPIGAAQSLRVLGEALAHDPNRADAAEHALTRAADILRDRGHEWGLALVELSLGELELRRRQPAAADRLRRTLHYWTTENIPLLQARALVALATATEPSPESHGLLLRAYHLYRDHNAPQATELAHRLRLT
jgi:DNA-binding SARP family transcriptional activator/tetratricopeptide (TPR) repeat protein